MQKKRAIMVALSAAVMTPALPSSALGQVMLQCPVIFRVGNIVKCGVGGSVIIEPDGNLKSALGCASLTNTPQPARCTVETGGVAVTKNVKVSFDVSPVMVKMGGNSFLLDQLQMSYTGLPVPASSIVLTPNQVKSGGVTIKIGGRINPIANSPLGMYSGEITINANEL